MMEHADVAIIGGGVTGLALAYRLRCLGRDAMVLEASHRVGGVIRSERCDGYLLEHGPFSVLPRGGALRSLITDLGLEPIECSAGARRGRYVQLNGRLRRVPTSPRSFLTTSLLSTRAKLGVVRRVLRSAALGAHSDGTIHELACRRFGREATDRIVSPGCVGIFAAEAKDLSADACAPRIACADGHATSTRGLLRSARDPDAGPRPPSMITLDGGLETLVHELHRQLGGAVVTRWPIETVERQRSGFLLRGSAGTCACNAIVMCVGAPATARVLQAFAPRVSARLKTIQHADLGVVHLGYERARVRHSLDGFGYLVAGGEPTAQPVLGVIWPGSTFGGVAPPGRALLRAVVGGTRWPGALDVSDEQLAGQTKAALSGPLGLSGEPDFIRVTRWPGSVPVYGPGHRALVEAALSDHALPDGVVLAGPWVCGPAGGLGVSDRVRHAFEIAETLAEKSASEQMGPPAPVNAEVTA